MKLLNKIQQEIKAPKTQKNTHGGYMYRSCSDILSAVKTFLTEGGAYLHMTDDLVELAGRYYVKATVTLTHGSEKVVATGFAREADDQKGMNAGQLSCSTSSYARKLALSGLFAIDDSHDAGNGKGKDEKPLSPVQAIKAVFKVFTDKHETALAEGFTYDLAQFKAALKKKADELYEGEDVKWTIDVVTELATKLRPKDVWIEEKD